MIHVVRNFLTDQSPLKSPWHSWGKNNIEMVPMAGLRLWCRSGTGSGVMLEKPIRYGRWSVGCQVSGPLDRVTTKICLLLWPAGGSPWPPELDFNESGLRLFSHQTEHYGIVDQTTGRHPEIHRSYQVNQTQRHLYEVEVMPTMVKFYCDGVEKPGMVNLMEDVFWNVHLRAEPHNAPQDETHIDVQRVEVMEYAA